MKTKLAQFLYGRNGMDDLCRFSYMAALALCVLALITRWMLFYYMAMALLAWCVYRSFSRNLHGRQRENQSFLAYKYRAKAWFTGLRSRAKQTRTHRFYKCPQCSQQLRVPRGKGKISITCPKCHTSFEKKT